jgi:hypothetical protein
MYDIVVNAQDGWTDCPVFTTPAGDARDYVANGNFGFGWGDLNPWMVSVFLSSLQGWYGGYDPYAYGTMLKVDNTGTGYELGYAIQFDHACYSVASPAVPRATPTGATFDHVVWSYPYWWYYLP